MWLYCIWYYVATHSINVLWCFWSLWLSSRRPTAKYCYIHRHNVKHQTIKTICVAYKYILIDQTCTYYMHIYTVVHCAVRSRMHQRKMYLIRNNIQKSLVRVQKRRNQYLTMCPRGLSTEVVRLIVSKTIDSLMCTAKTNQRTYTRHSFQFYFVELLSMCEIWWRFRNAALTLSEWEICIALHNCGEQQINAIMLSCTQLSLNETER